MHRNTVIALLLFLNGVTFSQQGWFWLNPLPQGNAITSVSWINSSVAYYSAYNGALYKSTNGGFNFFNIPTGVTGDFSANFINESTGFSPYWQGLLKTTNGGYYWEYIQAPVSTVSQAILNPSIVLYSLTNNLIYKSTDVGLTWTISLTPTVNTVVNSFHFVNQFTGYAVGKKLGFTYSKIYKTTNGGNNWDSIASNIRKEFLGVNFTSENTGYVTATFGSNKIYKTTNGCLSWDTVYSPNFGGFPYIKFFNDNEGYARAYQNIAKTTNGGINWQDISTSNTTFLFNINEGLGIGTLGGENFIYRTTNSGFNWTQISQGFGGDFWDVTFINENTGFTIAKSKIFKTTNEGIDWSEYYLGLEGWPPYLENIMFVNDNTGYAGIDGGRIAKTTNCGTNWKVYETGNYDHCHGMAFPSADTGYVVTKYGFYLKTTNGGVNWINFGQQNNESYGDICFIDNNTGFAGGKEEGGGDGIIRKTTNGGLTWSSTILDSLYWTNDICVSDSSTWFAAGYGFHNYTGKYPGFIYRSTDLGLSWSYIRLDESIASINFPTRFVGYASAENGVMYKTTDGGNSWFPTDCVSKSPMYGLYFINENTGYGVGYGGRIIKTTTGGGNFIGIQPISTEVPNTFLLHQNYPNPFNPATKIKFELSHSSFVKLTIYDVLGREVSVLVNEELKSGIYSIDFNGTNLPSGVYFYRLQTEDFTQTRKMVLIK